WSALKEIAAAQSVSVSRLVTKIDSKRQYANLSSAIRLFILVGRGAQGEGEAAVKRARPFKGSKPHSTRQPPAEVDVDKAGAAQDAPKPPKQEYFLEKSTP